MKERSLVIIPCYNENTNIERLLREILAQREDLDVLVIDDSSPDGTSETVRRFTAAEKRTNINLIVRPRKMGLGTAYLEGFAWALKKGYDRIVTMDADFSHQPRYLKELVARSSAYDMVVGSRYVAGGGIDGWPPGRRILSFLGNGYARLVTGIPVRDCTSGFMVMRRELLSELMGREIVAEGYAFLLELKHVAWRKGYAIGEYPITFTDRKAGVSKISKKIICEAFFAALKMRFLENRTMLRGNSLFKLVDRYGGIPVVLLLGIIGRLRPARKTDNDGVLVIKLSALGDTILLAPSLRALRQCLPSGVKITALCTSINSAVMRACPYIDETIVIDIGKIARNPLSLTRVFEKRTFDIALDFDQWLRFSPVLAFLSGARRRIGFRTPGQLRHFLYTDAVVHERKRHEVDCFLEIVRKLGIKGDEKKLEYWVSDDDKKAAAAVIASMGLTGKPFVIMHPETPAHGVQRQWPPERYAALGRKISCPIVISGTSREISSNRRLVSEIGKNAQVLPPVPINVFASIVASSRVVICGNTGIMHLACALKTPVVALHGPTDPAKWGPASDNSRIIASRLPCSPCLYLGFEYGCRTNACMRSIPVDEVCRAVEELLAISS